MPAANWPERVEELLLLVEQALLLQSVSCAAWGEGWWWWWMWWWTWWWLQYCAYRPGADHQQQLNHCNCLFNVFHSQISFWRTACRAVVLWCRCLIPEAEEEPPKELPVWNEALTRWVDGGVALTECMGLPGCGGYQTKAC